MARSTLRYALLLAGLLLVVSAGSAHAGDITATSLAEVLTYSRPEILAYTKATMQTAVLLGWRCQAAINTFSVLGMLRDEVMANRLNPDAPFPLLVMWVLHKHGCTVGAIDPRILGSVEPKVRP